eukprot:19412-Prymnesium_polylepis.1
MCLPKAILAVGESAFRAGRLRVACSVCSPIANPESSGENRSDVQSRDFSNDSNDSEQASRHLTFCTIITTWSHGHHQGWRQPPRRVTERRVRRGGTYRLPAGVATWPSA